MKLKIVALIFLLFSQTMAYQVSLPDLVLCVGDDGHIALEESKANEGCTLHPQLVNDFRSPYPISVKSHHDIDLCVDFILDGHLGSAQFKHEFKTLRNAQFSNVVILKPQVFTPAIHIVKNEQSGAIPVPTTQTTRFTILII